MIPNILFRKVDMGNIGLDVIILVQHANGWEFRKIVRDLSQAQKGNPYLLIYVNNRITRSSTRTRRARLFFIIKFNFGRLRRGANHSKSGEQ